MTKNNHQSLNPDPQILTPNLQPPNSKSLLVTGGAGFIGSEFVRQAVSRGYKVVVVDKLTYAGDLERLKEVKDKITFYCADITNKEFIEYIFKTEKPDIVVHWAAESHVDRSIIDATPFIETNIKGTQVLLDAAKRLWIEDMGHRMLGRKDNNTKNPTTPNPQSLAPNPQPPIPNLQPPTPIFVNIATDEVYGELGESGKFSETTPLNPNSPYSVSKASADMLGRAYFRTYGLPVVTVRPSNNYGPWQYPEKLIPVVILKALNNEPIPVYGRGENIREWLYVSDCVQAIFDIIEKGEPGEIYNVGSGFEKRNIDVVRTILKILNKPESLISFVKDRPGHDFRYSLNTEKIQKEIGWKAKVSFEEGIEKTVNWYLENLDWVKRKLNYLRQWWDRVYNS